MNTGILWYTSVMQADFVTSWDHHGVVYTVDVFFRHDFSGVEISKVNQSYGVVLNEKKEVLLVSKDRKSWNLPGGHVESGEGLVETLIREVFEESAVRIKEDSIRPFFFQKVYKAGNRSNIETIQVRYLANADSVGKFKMDPGGEVRYQRWVCVKDIPEYLDWGGLESVMVKKITEHISMEA